MPAPTLPAPTANLSNAMPGMWWLLSRGDWTKDGRQITEPMLGNDPIAIVCYSTTHFAAQFMKRDRKDINEDVSYISQNNTSAVGGYDAYFGTYVVDENTGMVAHTLIGSLESSHIGKTFYRNLRVNDNKLILQLETTTPKGEAVTRTLIWQRMN